jgi:predicted transcriptional regulator of viral defense system
MGIPTDSSAISAAVRPEPVSCPSATDRSDRAIAELASARHGVVTLAELEALGLSPRAVRHRVASGRLHRVHRGIYASDGLTQYGRWTAAVVASGHGALLSHRSAAALWGLARREGREVDVTVARLGHRRPGIALHSRCKVEPADIASHNGIPCTSVARTLVDYAATVDRGKLVRAIDRAEELRLFDLAEVRETLRRCQRRRGAPLLRAVLADYDGPVETSNFAEDRFLALVDGARLPRPLVNSWMPLAEGSGYRPDFYWPDARLIVEVDGRTHHARRRAFEHDRRRDRRLALEGLRTCRYAATELEETPETVIAEVRRLLGSTDSHR